jgi:cysteine desulfurase
MSSPDRAYLDWNASAPLRPEARKAFTEALDRFGNPSSPHAEGRAARDLLESSREQVAAFLDCEPSEVVFTSGGTEANALALASLAAGARIQSFAAARIEHPSVLRPLEALSKRGWQTNWLRVGEEGRASPESSGSPEKIGFACLQAANHETGALQPLETAAAFWSERGLAWHCDATQAWGRLRLSARALTATTASLSGHKLGAPKGVGALYVRRGTAVEPLLRGGPQERGRRAGTENLPGIAALAAAVSAAGADLDADASWTRGLRDRLEAGAKEVVPLAWINGPEEPDERLPNTVNLSFPGTAADFLVQALDLEGVAISAGSACASGALEASEVLLAMGVPEWRLRSAVRVSLGSSTSPAEVDRFLRVLRGVLARKGSAGGT